jgi:CzcA family heavy metal efflux pump
MFDAIIRWALHHAAIVIALTLLLVGAGGWAAVTMPLDVLPELAAPSVTVVTEARGMAPEEVERQVTVPLEQALNGAPGIRRVRSSSAIGISLVWAEFDWDVDPRVARQVVAEKIATARDGLPQGIDPLLAPTSSIMGEILFVGVTGDQNVSDGELREAAEWIVRRRLLAVSGIAQVVPIGGAIREVQIILSPERLMEHRIGTGDVLRSLSGITESVAGSFHVAGPQEYVIRAIARPVSLEALARMHVGDREGVPILLGDVAEVRFGEQVRRGAAAVQGERAVVLKVQKQPQANTLELTKRVERALDEVERTLPRGVSLYRKGFRQADFITVALRNVISVLRDGALLVSVVLALFLASLRPTLISLLALPISLLTALLVLRVTGASINTMTLGGLAIAIGALVDDAIIDVENVMRRLRERALVATEERRSVLDVVYEASSEIRGSIVFATVAILLVFLPLFFLSGIEGRLLRPLGIAYFTSIAASLLVALTITPVLCLLLVARRESAAGHESRLGAWLKQRYRPIVEATVRAPIAIGITSLAGAAAAVMLLLSFGRSFLPEFNEGSLNIAAATAPGTSLETSEQIVGRLERFLTSHPAVTSVIRSTGRAERDEHALDVNYSELEVGLDLEKGEREAVFSEIRKEAASIPGLSVAVGQPISHRIEHLASGVRASLALKIFGEDLDRLRLFGRTAENVMRQIPGVVDVALEQQTEIPVVAIRPKDTELAAFGQSPGELARFVEMALAGTKVGDWRIGERTQDVMVRLPETLRDDLDLLAKTPVDVDGRRYAELGGIADITKTLGPNLINRENVQRRVIVSANVADRDLRGAATDTLSRVHDALNLPAGYRIELGGSYESEASATRTLFWFSIAALAGVIAMLFLAFRSTRDVLIVLLNLPLALVGGAIAVALGGGVLSIASLVGFVTLFGIAIRNGIMLVTHYRRLVTVEGIVHHQAVVQGSVDRLLPILMTALTAALALVPIALAGGEPGNEIQAPMAIVILGGLSSSTVLNLIVIPPLYARFGREKPY